MSNKHLRLSEVYRRLAEVEKSAKQIGVYDDRIKRSLDYLENYLKSKYAPRT